LALPRDPLFDDTATEIRVDLASLGPLDGVF
jgi:hypothetical protein